MYREGIQGAGFDLDGTLYANYKLNIRLIPLGIRELPLLLALTRARKRLHAEALNSGREAPLGGADFYDVQAAYTAELLKKEPSFVKEKLERLVYRSSEEHFSHIKPFPHLKETLSAFSDAGISLGLLSDFPVKRKLELLGLEGFFGTAFSSEETGVLKPGPLPFLRLAEKMELSPGQILYVGNSPHYDVAGAKSAGMKTALIRRGPPSTGYSFGRALKQADFVFSDYRQLREYVLG